MKISELIEKLSVIKKEHGDLVCLSYDGLNPSDYETVHEVRVEKDDSQWHDQYGEKVVKIEAI